MDKAVSALLLGILVNCAGNKCSLLKYNALISCLTKLNIPFDANFTPSTRKEAGHISITINISPAASLVYSWELI